VRIPEDAKFVYLASRYGVETYRVSKITAKRVVARSVRHRWERRFVRDDRHLWLTWEEARRDTARILCTLSEKAQADAERFDGLVAKWETAEEPDHE